MTDEGLKKTLGFVLRNKTMIMSLLERFDAYEVEMGILSIPQEMVNRDLKMLIMDKTTPYLEDYSILMNTGSLYLDLELNAKQLGKISAKCMLTIEDFRFQGEEHKIRFSYKEDVKSQGNFIQSMALKAAGLKGNYLETAAEMAKLDFIQVDKNEVLIDLDKIEGIKKLPPSLSLSYLGCENGNLKLKFSI
ncbi:hypothetical protein [Sinanaerobacter chloroacetimidivorans]|uniref:Uncharacterized protein n=1 Tax=Sinanaerobacter chloroacetimidivorans TaxID=2818044 RepID=A0A8J8B5H9_9FIRM|nr:hypothetical protein [Sinanaerobacter chloroacetimidivorans]MBR0600355.1 hypothetical protein [Sinanaerobacter chloroacetimidivorans]